MKSDPALATAKKYIRNTTIVAGYGLAMYLSALVFDRAPPVEQLEQREELTGLKPGAAGNIFVRVKRKRLCSTDVDVILFDGDGSRFVVNSARDLLSKRLGEDEYRVYIKIPSDFTPGKSYGYFHLTYRCNALHRLWPVEETLDEFVFSVKP